MWSSFQYSFCLYILYKLRWVVIGYGQAKVEYDFGTKTVNANLTRNVLFVGHKFGNKYTSGDSGLTLVAVL